MKINEIYTAYVSWNTNGKRRPVLVVKDADERISCYKITSKYKNKSEKIKKNYYPLLDWEQEGLNKQSYVDVGRIELLDKDKVTFHYVGELSINDTRSLIEFIKNRYNLYR